MTHLLTFDTSGIYCLLTVATALNILTPELLAGTPEFIASCQTYEGGFCNASFPGFAQLDGPYSYDVLLGFHHKIDSMIALT